MSGEQRTDVQPPFFLVGAERSGTTLLRLMLDHHPCIRCGYESEFLVDRLDRARRLSGEKLAHVWDGDYTFEGYRHAGLPAPPHVQSYDELVAWFFRAMHEQSGKSTVGVTVHLHPQHLPEIAPAARYIHLIRDGRPVAASVVQMGWAGNAYHGALYWKRTMTRVLALREQIRDGRWLDVRYEDLLADPPAVLQRICAHLNTTYDDNMLSYAKTTTYDAPEPGNAQRWRTKMSPREIWEAEMAAGDILDALGFERRFPPVQPGAVERAMLAIGNRIGRWRFGIRRYGWYLLFARKLLRLFFLRSRNLESRYSTITRAHIK